MVLGQAALYPGGAEYKVAWAMRLFESGIESESLAILATLMAPVNAFEADAYFLKVLSELGITPPDREQALRGYARALAKKVVSNTLAPDIGVAKIYEVNVHLDYPGLFAEFTALEDEWYCESIQGWSQQRRNLEIVNACEILCAKLHYPDVFST